MPARTSTPPTSWPLPLLDAVDAGVLPPLDKTLLRVQEVDDPLNRLRLPLGLLGSQPAVEPLGPLQLVVSAAHLDHVVVGGVDGTHRSRVGHVVRVVQRVAAVHLVLVLLVEAGARLVLILAPLHRRPPPPPPRSLRTPPALDGARDWSLHARRSSPSPCPSRLHSTLAWPALGRG